MDGVLQGERQRPRSTAPTQAPQASTGAPAKAAEKPTEKPPPSPPPSSRRAAELREGRREAAPAAKQPEKKRHAAPAAKPRPDAAAAEPAKGTTSPEPRDAKPAAKAEASDEPQLTVLRGAPARTAQNMDTSLTVPTATSVRTVPVKLLFDNRIVINNHLARARGGKVSLHPPHRLRAGQGAARRCRR